MSKFTLAALFLLFAQFLAGLAFAADKAPGRKAKSVILFLGDGTGLATVHAASILGHGKPQALFIHTMPHMGLSETSTASDWVSDSAAGMTAIVTGQKTHNGVISEADNSEHAVKDGTALKTILEYAEERGLATGVVTNSDASDATPAACYAHGNDRWQWGSLFAQILKPRFGDGIDIVIGGGRNEILKQTAGLGIDIAAELKAKGYVFLDNPESRANIPSATRLVALYEGQPWDIQLAGAVDAALKILRQNPKGFFLMVESNNHFEDIRASLESMVRFDDIIRATAEKLRGADTLILFTADHSFDIRLSEAAPRGGDILPAMKVEGHHTAEEVLVLADGPGAERVHGFFPNTHLFDIMMAAYGWSPDSSAAKLK